MRLIDADELLTHIEDYGEGQCRLDLIDPYYVRNATTVNAIPLPENPTNGDVMIVIYGIADVEVNECSVRLFPKDGGQLWVTRDWWEAPYKEEQTDEL